LSQSENSSQKRWFLFGVWVVLSLALFAKPLIGLIQLAWQDETASHILLIPFISAWLLYFHPKGEVSKSGFAIRPAAAFLIFAALVGFLPTVCLSCSLRDQLSLHTLSLVLLLVAGFVLILGSAKATASSFALAFLLFTVPIPDLILNRIIYWLQAGSAAIAEVLFELSGAPVIRDGFVFRLPKMSIEVAAECSGIRSSLALLVLGLLLAHFSFRPLWKKVVFVFAGLCMMLIKNGIRIAALTLLANYVDPDFLYGNLHHRGGVVFFLIGLALLWPVYWYLRKGEQDSEESITGQVPAQVVAKR